jgi:diguanylate cyclase (GGDEF)-like protein
MHAGHHEKFGEAQLRRERLLDLEERIRPYRLAAFAVLGASLVASGPWEGWWWLIPLAGALLAFSAGDRLRARSHRPELWVAASWAVSPLMIAISVALTGAVDSPAIGWFALPLVTLASRFEWRGTIVGIGYSVALLLVATIPFDPAVAAADPVPLIHTFALMLAVTLLGGAIVQSDRDHRREAVLDPLTGLFNRAALAQRFADQRREGDTSEDRQVGVLIGDLDHFKLVNDDNGHAVGDAVLKDVAYLLRKHLRALDHVYRVGGEEFVAVLPGADLESAYEAAERLRTAIEAARPAGLTVSISFGVVVATGAECKDFDTLYRRADAALYQAKQGGRNSVRVAADGTQGSRPEPAHPLPA